MNIVIDTNVFVGAAFSPASSSGQILAAVADGRLQLVWDDATRGETMRVLAKIPPIDEDEFVDLFDDDGHFDGSTTPEDFEIVADPADRKFAALAAAADVVLISNDSDLLDVRDELPVQVQTPSEFVSSRPEVSS